MRASLTDRFWARVLVREPNECWPWQGARFPKGYGTIGSGIKEPVRGKGLGRNKLTHRVSWEIHHGPIPEDMLVCHHCDNPPCVNPAHLFLGTPLDNSRDRDAKGRQRYLRGETHQSAKMKEKQILEILDLLRSGRTQRSIARQYGINRMIVYDVAHGRRWKHITTCGAV